MTLSSNREVDEVPKKSLLDDVDSGNEANLESEEDTPTTFVLEPIIAYLNNPECNNPADDEGEWVINEDVAFDYFLSLDDVFNSAENSSLHISLPTSNMVCTHVEDNEGFVFIVPPSKRNQLPIVFGGIRPQTTASKDSNEDLEPSQFFHYTRLAYRMMRRIEYNLRCGDCLNFRKGQRIPLQPFLSKEKPAKYYDQTYRELGYVTPPNKSESEINKSPLSYSSSSSNWESYVSVGVTLKKSLRQYDVNQSGGAR